MSVALDILKLKATKMLIIGDVMIDRYVFGNVNRISPEAPVPILHVQNSVDKLGGAGNVALNLKMFSECVTLVSLHGLDTDGHQLVKMLEENSIEFRPINKKNYRTIVKTRLVAQGQQILRLDFEDRHEPTINKEIIKNIKDDVDTFSAIVLSDYSKGTVNNCSDLINFFSNHNKQIFVDPKGHDFENYRGATLLTPNRSEFRAVAGEWKDDDELFHKAHQLRRNLKLNALLVTRSEEGMTLFDVQEYKESSMHVSALSKEVFDVTGAGDTVIAIIALMSSAGYSLRDAVMIANKAASIVVGKIGASQVSYEELIK